MDGVAAFLLVVEHLESQVDRYQLDASRTEVSNSIKDLLDWSGVKHILHSERGETADADCY